MNDPIDEKPEKKLRGFARLSPEKRLELARKGGAAVSPENRAFSNKSIASRAGTKGGSAVPADKRSFSKDAGLASRASKESWASRRGKNNE